MNNKNSKKNTPEFMQKICSTITKNRGTIILLALVFLFVGIAMKSSLDNMLPENVDNISVEEFYKAIDDGRIQNVDYNLEDQEAAGLWDKEGSGEYSTYLVSYSVAGIDTLREKIGEHPSVKYTASTDSRYNISSSQKGYIVFAALILIVVLLWKWLRKSGETIMSNSDMASVNMNFDNRRVDSGTDDKIKDKNKNDDAADAFNPPVVTFDDIAGCDEALAELVEVKDFLINPQKYTRLGAKIPTGIIMAGPPGCGKTYMAKALAGESGATFFSMSGSDFVEMFVGVGPKRVRELFATAKKNMPAIIFIDEIDAVGKKRGGANANMGSDGETDRTLNQLLVEMDGFGTEDNIIVIAATNRIDTLDPALLRPGRFDRHIMVDLPDKSGRQEILAVHSKNKPLSDNVDMEHYATITAGMSGAQLANLMNEAAIYAARRGADVIDNIDMNDAFERIVAGAEKKSRVLSDEEKKTTAYHEAGHAIVGHILEGADKVSKISIISRGQALGYTLTLPENDTFLQTRQHLKDKLAMFLGGLVAEEMINDQDISTGPSNDLERATNMATAMVTRFGMSDELGRRAFVSDSSSYTFTKPYSEQKGQEIDSAVDKLMNEAHNKALEILNAYRSRLDKLAEVLIRKEVVEGQEMEDLLNGCWKGDGAYEHILSSGTQTGRLGESETKDEQLEDTKEKEDNDTNAYVGIPVPNTNTLQDIKDKLQKKKEQPEIAYSKSDKKERDK